jgi:uncharacterized protein (DUF1330 family)
MPAYVIVNVATTDPAEYETYKERHSALWRNTVAATSYGAAR